MMLKHLRLTFIIVLLVFSFLTFISLFVVPVHASSRYEYYNTGDDAVYSIHDAQWLAQTFTVDATAHTVTSVKLYMQRSGYPDILNVSIRATASGVPTSSDLTFGTTNASLFSTSKTWYEITLAEYTLSANTKYALVCRALQGNATNLVYWRRDYTAAPYNGGNETVSTNSGSTWSIIAGADHMFEVWGNSLDTTYPTYSSISANTTVAGALCSFNCLVNDDTNVSTYIFSTNNTGTWTNDSATTFSNFFNTTAAWANVAKTLNGAIGNVVSYLWYANDTSNNWSKTEQYNLTLTALYRPNLQMTPDKVTCRKYLETFSIQINVTNAIDTKAFNFTIYYDPLVLNYSSVSWGELGTGTMTEIDTTNGILEGNVADSPITGNHWLLNITFEADKTIIWKDGLTNKLEGKIWFHQAQLNFTDNSTLQYIEGGINQIDVNQTAYTFLPIQGDVNNNGTVDVLDLRTVARYYDKTPADPEWPEASKYDLKPDNAIDIFDLIIVASNFGFNYI